MAAAPSASAAANKRSNRLQSRCLTLLSLFPRTKMVAGNWEMLAKSGEQYWRFLMLFLQAPDLLLTSMRLLCRSRSDGESLSVASGVAVFPICLGHCRYNFCSTCPSRKQVTEAAAAVVSLLLLRDGGLPLARLVGAALAHAAHNNGQRGMPMSVAMGISMLGFSFSSRCLSPCSSSSRSCRVRWPSLSSSR